MCSAFSEIRRNEHGATLTEFAVSFIPFFFIVYGLMAFVTWAYSTMTLQFALNSTARWAITGQSLTDPGTGATLNRVDSVRLRFRQALIGLGQTPDDTTLSLCPINNPNCTVDSAASANRHVVLRAAKNPMNFFGFSGLAPQASVIIRNEPFEP